MIAENQLYSCVSKSQSSIKSEEWGRRWKHYEVSNLKRKAFSNMNFVSYGRVENVCYHKSVVHQETAMN